MLNFKIEYWKESGYCTHKDRTEEWSCENKEELFLRILKANNHIQKNFHKDNGDCYRFADYKLQDEYDDWWYKLGDEKRDEIFIIS